MLPIVSSCITTNKGARESKIRLNARSLNQDLHEAFMILHLFATGQRRRCIAKKSDDGLVHVSTTRDKTGGVAFEVLEKIVVPFEFIPSDPTSTFSNWKLDNGERRIFVTLETIAGCILPRILRLFARKTRGLVVFFFFF